MTISFVDELDIARDLRLPGLDVLDPHIDLEGFTDGGPKKGGKPGKPRLGERSPAIGEGVKAAVDAGSILSFVAGLDAEQKSDVLFSTQLAQRAASAKHDRFKATKDWYGVYVDVLERLGWIVEGLAFTQRGSSAGHLRMDRSALDVIATLATGNQLAILVRTLDTLKKLGEGERPLEIFDMQAMREASGNYQLGAAQKADNEAISLALGAFHFRADDHRRKFLFWQWGAEAIEFWTAVSKLTLNSESYAAHRVAVRKKLAADWPAYIAELEIA